MQRIKQLTETLILQLDDLHEHFKKRDDIDTNTEQYFSYVKSELNDKFLLLEDWYRLTHEKIKNGQLNVPETMLESTKDNMEQLMLHSYYFDVRIRRYNEIKKSCLYVYHTILDEINDKLLNI